MESNSDQLARSASFDLRHADHAADSAGGTKEAQSDDIDSDEVTEVLFYAAVLLGSLLLAAVAAAVVFGLRALGH
jgi:hypothetical protein